MTTALFALNRQQHLSSVYSVVFVLVVWGYGLVYFMWCLFVIFYNLNIPYWVKTVSNSWIRLQRNKIKIAKVNKLELPAKTVGVVCKFPYKCYDRISDENQLTFLKTFWPLNSKIEQNNRFLCTDSIRTGYWK